MKITYLEKVINKLSTMEVGAEFNIDSFVKKNWGLADFYKRRSFDVYFCNAKKDSLFENKSFRTIRGSVVRKK